MFEEHTAAQEPTRQTVEQRAQRIGDRLGLEVEVEAGEVAPAGIPAQLDQPRAEVDAEREPAQEPEHENRWRSRRERPRIEERNEEDREEAGFAELDLPAVAVPQLPDMDEREIECPEEEEQDAVREAEEQREREHDARPCESEERTVGDPDPKQARELKESMPARSPALGDAFQETLRWKQTVVSDQRENLQREREKREDVHKAEQPQHEETREPVARAGGKHAAIVGRSSCDVHRALATLSLRQVSP